MRLHGYKLVLVRAVWMVVILFTTGLFVAAIPVRFAELQTLCIQTQVSSPCNLATLYPDDLVPLHQSGLSLRAYAVYHLALEVGYTLVFFGVAVVIFWRRADDWMALFASLTLITFGASFPPVLEALARMQPVWRWPTLLLQEFSFVCFVVFVCVFPDGQFVPRWTRWLALVWALWNVVRPALIQTTPFLLHTAPFSVGQVENIAMILLASLGLLIAIIHYRRLSSPLQRQQSKWVVFGLTVTLLGFWMYLTLHQLYSPLNQPGPAHVWSNLASLPLLLFIPGLLIPLTIGSAILRYHLWQIDLIVRRTLIYSALTAVLAIIYFGSIVLLQQIFGRLLGPQQNQFGIVVSTLAIAVLFAPLRRGVQDVIDRRFYRHKYDAAQILAAFNATVREAVELDQLTVRLVAAVEETLQPTYVSLWLTPAPPAPRPNWKTEAERANE